MLSKEHRKVSSKRKIKEKGKIRKGRLQETSPVKPTGDLLFERCKKTTPGSRRSPEGKI